MGGASIRSSESAVLYKDSLLDLGVKKRPLVAIQDTRDDEIERNKCIFCRFCWQVVVPCFSQSFCFLNLESRPSRCTLEMATNLFFLLG